MHRDLQKNTSKQFNKIREKKYKLFKKFNTEIENIKREPNKFWSLK